MKLLGDFRLSTGGEAIDIPPAAQRLLALVAIHDGPIARGHAAFTLWPSVPEPRAHANFRSVLWRLRRPGVVVATLGHVRLAPHVAVDHRGAREVARGIIADPRGFTASDPADLPLSADLLPTWSDEWLTSERERFRQLRLHALEILSAHLAEVGRHARAVEAGLLAIAAEPLRESAHRALIVAYLAEGNRVQAIRQYEWYRRLVKGELAIDPSPEMEDLARRARPATRNGRVTNL
jgi:DNA-binding SARP family transcriptional activator